MITCINGKKKLMYKLILTMLQNYARDKVTDHSVQGIFHHNGWECRQHNPFYYEFTVTYNPSYWTKNASMQVVPQVIADVLKPVIRQGPGNIIIRYSVEYHENGYPHIHGQVLTDYELLPDIQRSIHQRLCRRYGRSQWYQTENEDKYHETSGMLWSQYIQKDVVKNSSSGLQHYHEYCVRF